MHSENVANLQKSVQVGQAMVISDLLFISMLSSDWSFEKKMVTNDLLEGNRYYRYLISEFYYL